MVNGQPVNFSTRKLINIFFFLNLKKRECLRRKKIKYTCSLTVTSGINEFKKQNKTKQNKQINKKR